MHLAENPLEGGIMLAHTRAPISHVKNSYLGGGRGRGGRKEVEERRFSCFMKRRIIILWDLGIFGGGSRREQILWLSTVSTSYHVDEGR